MLQSEPLPPESSQAGLIPFILNSIWGSSSLAALCAFDLSIWELKTTIISTLAVGALLAAYVTVLPQSMKKSRLFYHVNIESSIDKVSQTVAAAIGVLFLSQALFLGLTTTSLISIALLGLLKGAMWYFSIQTVRLANTTNSFAPFSQWSRHVIPVGP